MRNCCGSVHSYTTASNLLSPNCERLDGVSFYQRILTVSWRIRLHSLRAVTKRRLLKSNMLLLYCQKWLPLSMVAI